MIDGASFFQIFRRILLPNSTPIFIVTIIYSSPTSGTTSYSARLSPQGISRP
jgi:ABC-type maltose transport system permease subunit